MERSSNLLISNNRAICAFTGASGTGKTTLLKLIDKELNFATVELSARPYLSSNGSYDQTNNDSTQRKIMFGSTVAFAKSILNEYHSNIFFSRCAIDKLAYAQTLDLARDVQGVVKQEIEEIVKPYVQVFYIPIEFPMKEENDIIRGANEEIRRKTDQNIRAILAGMNIDFILVSGTVKERFETIKKSLKIWIQ